VLGGAQLVAEDLGVITEDVIAMRQALGIPGMRVLQFAFDGNPHDPHLPANHGPDTICYTGTHDNDTTLGWWHSAPAHERDNIARFLGQAEPAMPHALVDCAVASPAPLSILPMQDLLELGAEARMNQPGVAEGNWCWRFDWAQLSADFGPALRARLAQHGRLP
jgi:4-alpha-glucanotransferase